MKYLFITLRQFIFLVLLLLTSYISAQNISVRDSLMEFEADTMPEPFRVLNEVFVTPDGRDPVDYILDNVARKTEENRKTLNYTASTTFHLYASDMDLLPLFLSKTQNWVVKTAMGMMGMRAMYNYVTQHRETAMGIRIEQKAKGKNTDFTSKEIMFSPSDMPENVSEQITKMAEFPLFDAVYGNKHLLDRKKRHKIYEIEFIGSGEEEDGTIYYILKVWRNKGKAHQREITLHIVDGAWGILRQELKSSTMSSYIQCRNISGIYLPVKCVKDPNPMTMEQLADEARKSLTDTTKDNTEISKTERKLLERIEKVAKGERKNAPMMKYSFEVSYN